MSTGDDSRSIQESELSSLKCIYEGLVEDLRKPAAWNAWIPLDISVTLGPSRSWSRKDDQDHLSVDLRVICSYEYPKVSPEIKLKNKRGVSDVLLCTLTAELNSEAKKLVGQEMIYNLAQYVQEFLYKHNKPGLKSFYEEMVKTNEDKEQKKKEAQQLEDDMRKLSMQEEISRRKSEQEQAKQVSFEESSSESDEESRDPSPLQNMNLNRSLSTCQDHTGVEEIEFTETKRIVQRGTCLRHVDDSCVIYQCLGKDCGSVYCLTEWKIEKDKIDKDYINRKLTGIYLEVTKKLATLSHPNLCSYIDFKYFDKEDYIFIYLLSEYVRSPTCSLLSNKGPIQLEYLIKYVARGVLTALSFLHAESVVHRDLNPDCVLIDNEGHVKVTNYSIQRRINDLIKNTTHTPEDRYNQRKDIYDFGVFLLSIVTGEPLTDGNMQIPSDLNTDLYDLLKKCLGSKQLRQTASDLLQHRYLHSDSEPSSLKRSTSGLVRIAEQVDNLKDVLKVEVHDKCRIVTEFYVLGRLGEGAFGSVIKVKNKLDGNLYAVKVIKLEAKKTILIRKIIREVKLLSRLNHENIVRYYHSWIEVAPVERNNDLIDDTTISKLTVLGGDTTDVRSVDNKSPNVVVVRDCQPESLLKAPDSEDEEDANCEDDEDEDDDDDDDDNEENEDAESSIDKSEQKTEASDHSESIVFQNPSEGVSFIQFEEGEKSEVKQKKITKTDNSLSYRPEDDKSNLIRTLYIQMELCEKNSLRDAIEKRKYSGDKIWMLFREIVEGIAYIHEQGMMHRDLKPDNIFLDLEGRVKIGDFGLAKNIVNRRLEDFRVDSDPEYPEDDKKTGAIGTALYIAPELNNISSVDYNEKVDMYSLGIILFEMWYPFDTKMERVKTITELRNKEIKFPKDFEKKEMELQIKLIRWLLNHDSTKRPTSQELLKSDLLPLPEVEDEKMKNLIRHAVINPQSKSYKYLISSCFQQEVTGAQDLMYDRDESFMVNASSLQLCSAVKQYLINIFRRFGGIELSTPALLPKCKFYEGVDSYVRLMSHDGVVVSLPHDLRVPFARYVAWNKVTSLRRYCIEKVYREEKICGFRPQETWDCCFDIVTQSNEGFMADAEILYICNKVLCSLRVDSKCVIRMNHTLLFDAILMQHGIMEKKNELLNVFTTYQEGHHSLKTNLKELFLTYNISTKSINPLLNLFNSDITDITKLPHILANMSKKSNNVGKMTKKALYELKRIEHICIELGAEIETVLTPGLLHQANQYDGMIFQVVCSLKKKRRQVDVIASGGRYDASLDRYRTMMVQAGYLTEDITPKAVGVSLSLDKLCQIARVDFNGDHKKSNTVDVIVCSIHSKTTNDKLIMEKSKMLNKLRAEGINCFSVEYNTDDEIRGQCISYNCQYAILFTDNTRDSVKLRTFDGDNRFKDNYVKTSEIVKVCTALRSGSVQESCQTSYSRTDSKTSSFDKTEQADILVEFVTKQQPSLKKKLKTQMYHTFDKLLTRLKQRLVIIVHDHDSELMNTVAQLNLSSDEQYQTSMKNMLDKNPKQRRDLERLCDVMHSQKKQNPHAAMMLFSHKDSSYKMFVNY